MSKVRLSYLKAFFGFDFSNKYWLMAQGLKHKGLEVKPPKREVGGKKVQRLFLIPEELYDEATPEENRVAVSIDYSDIVEGGIITKIQKDVKYYNDDGTVYCQKVETELVRDEHGLKRSRCKAAYDYLWNTGKATPVQPFMEAILNHYQNQCSVWQLGNPNDLKGAIETETDTTINTYLDIVVDGNTKKVKDAAMEQLTGVKWMP